MRCNYLSLISDKLCKYDWLGCKNIYDLYDIPIMFPVRSKWFQDLNLKILWTLFSERLYDIMAAKQLLKLGYEWVHSTENYGM